MTLLTSRDQLLLPFTSTWDTPGERMGLEAERVGLRAGKPLRYSGEGSVLSLFDELVRAHGWREEREKPGGPVLSLARGASAITLEPGAQFELSGAPHEDVHALAAEVRAHVAEVASLEAARGLCLLGLGFSPLARREDLEWVPKSRYPIMREYLPTRGDHGLDMMLRTATVQVNVDHHSEQDALRKLRVLLGLAPVAQALFANSPFVEGRRSGWQTYRGRVWLDVDPDRSGPLPALWSRGATLGSYLDWALQVPMFLFKREGRIVKNTGQTFADFWAHGYEGERATLEDWKLHLNTLFPDVRLKHTLELRTVDSVPAEASFALPALVAGLLYDKDTLAAADELVGTLDAVELFGARERVAREGLAAKLESCSLRELGKKFVALAEQGLARRARRDAEGRDERAYLAWIPEVLERYKSLGDKLHGDLDTEDPAFLPTLCERARY